MKRQVAVVGLITAARRFGPREHGRQAARSKRDRTGGQGEPYNQLNRRYCAAGGT